MISGNQIEFIQINYNNTNYYYPYKIDNYYNNNNKINVNCQQLKEIIHKKGQFFKDYILKKLFFIKFTDRILYQEVGESEEEEEEKINNISDNIFHLYDTFYEQVNFKGGGGDNTTNNSNNYHRKDNFVLKISKGFIILPLSSLAASTTTSSSSKFATYYIKYCIILLQILLILSKIILQQIIFIIYLSLIINIIMKVNKFDLIKKIIVWRIKSVPGD